MKYAPREHLRVNITGRVLVKESLPEENNQRFSKYLLLTVYFFLHSYGVSSKEIIPGNNFNSVMSHSVFASWSLLNILID